MTKTIRLKIAFIRFVRGALAGALGSMIGLQTMGVSSFADLHIFLQSLTLAGIFGAITGGLLALDKYVRSAEEVI